MFKKWTQEQRDAVNEFLKECIRKNYKCSHCALKHKNNTCYFAYDCFLNDGNHWRDDED